MRGALVFGVLAAAGAALALAASRKPAPPPADLRGSYVYPPFPEPFARDPWWIQDVQEHFPTARRLIVRVEDDLPAQGLVSGVLEYVDVEVPGGGLTRMPAPAQSVTFNRHTPFFERSVLLS